MSSADSRARRTLDRHRRRHLGADATLLLLKADGGTLTFKPPLVSLKESWAPRISSGPGMTLVVAKNDADFNAAAREASHVVVTDSANVALNHQLFAVNRETTVPAGMVSHWVIGISPTGKRYVPA